MRKTFFESLKTRGCNRTVSTLTCAGHSDDGPVQCLGQGVEHGVGLVLLQGVPQASEYQHPHAHCHRQQQQLPV